MTKITIPAFTGQIQKEGESLIGDNQATVAINSKLFTGDLQPWKIALPEGQPTCPRVLIFGPMGETGHLWRHNSTGDLTTILNICDDCPPDLGFCGLHSGIEGDPCVGEVLVLIANVGTEEPITWEWMAFSTLDNGDTWVTETGWPFTEIDGTFWQTDGLGYGGGKYLLFGGKEDYAAPGRGDGLTAKKTWISNDGRTWVENGLVFDDDDLLGHYSVGVNYAGGVWYIVLYNYDVPDIEKRYYTIFSTDDGATWDYLTIDGNPVADMYPGGNTSQRLLAQSSHATFYESSAGFIARHTTGNSVEVLTTWENYWTFNPQYILYRGENDYIVIGTSRAGEYYAPVWAFYEMDKNGNLLSDKIFFDTYDNYEDDQWIGVAMYEGGEITVIDDGYVALVTVYDQDYYFHQYVGSSRDLIHWTALFEIPFGAADYLVSHTYQIP